MKYVSGMALLVVLFTLTNCASNNGTLKDDRMVVENSPILRVVIDDTASVDDYRKIQVALMERSGNSGRVYEVVDRQQAYQAAKKEQFRQHRVEADRFNNKEKYAFYSEFYGARGVIVPHIDCRVKRNIWTDEYKKVCNQFLSLIDANTSKVLVAIEVETQTSEMGLADWQDAVSKMNDRMPANISDIEIKYTDRMKAYRDDAERRGKVQAEMNFRDVAKAKSEDKFEEKKAGE